MVSFIDSEAEFKATLVRVGLADLEEKFVAKSWNTMAKFCFAHSAPPGTVIEDKFKTEVVEALCGTPEDPRAPVIKRLLFECYSMFGSDIRRYLDG